MGVSPVKTRTRWKPREPACLFGSDEPSPTAREPACLFGSDEPSPTAAPCLVASSLLAAAAVFAPRSCGGLCLPGSHGRIGPRPLLRPSNSNFAVGAIEPAEPRRCRTPSSTATTLPSLSHKTEPFFRLQLVDL
ncbi:hypothetical protein BS78_04G116000 [Paspalum vaginatum]|nr:hypothetical protein BS78_04G116000 [Paspalum vaginatum]